LEQLHAMVILVRLAHHADARAVTETDLVANLQNLTSDKRNMLLGVFLGYFWERKP
jgi:hypothetical protein